MSDFLTEDFLLQSEPARTLYHEYAKEMPIFDYHCHVSPKQVAENTQFENLTQVWLYGDHYKWRAMRSNGVAEKYCTGDASDIEKYQKWTATVTAAIGNPLYHWTHLELKRIFGIDGKVLCPETEEEIWNRCNELLVKPEFRVRGLMEQMNVKVVCTTDDPADSLEHHIAIKKDSGFKVKVLPCLRPDKVMAVDTGEAYISYIKKLGEAADTEISSYQQLLDVLERRHTFFHEQGCRLSDHGLYLPVYEEASSSELEKIFQKAISGKVVSGLEDTKFKAAILLHCGRLNAARGWTYQIHMGAIRNNNRRLFEELGPDTGFDAIADGPVAAPLANLLSALDQTAELPKTIIYCLNPRDNELIGAMIGCFQDGTIPGKVQFGSGWWFNDTKTGMISQMTTLANLGLLSRFVGMLTDSRSFLSYPRHEYFRRILCNLIGGWVANGEAPNDMKLLGGMVQDISFNNAKDYFGIEVL